MSKIIGFTSGSSQTDPSASAVTLGVIKGLQARVKTLETDKATIDISTIILKQAQDTIIERIKTEAAGTATTIANAYTSSSPVDMLSVQLYQTTKDTIAKMINDITPDEVKTSFKHDITLNHKANIAWYNVTTSTAANKDFMIDNTKFVFQENDVSNEFAGVETRITNMLSALMKSNKLIYKAGNHNDAELDAIAPFITPDNKILPEHVGLAAHPDASNNNFSRDIILLNNAFRTNVNTNGSIKYDNLSNDYTFDYNRDTDLIKTDNNYYRNNTFVEQVTYLQHYTNRFVRPSIETDIYSKDAYKFAYTISHKIGNSTHLKSNDDFKKYLSNALIGLRNIVNGGTDNDKVYENLQKLIAALIENCQNGTNKAIYSAAGAAGGDVETLFENGIVIKTKATTEPTTITELVQVLSPLIDTNEPIGTGPNKNLHNIGATFAVPAAVAGKAATQDYIKIVVKYITYAIIMASETAANAANDADIAAAVAQAFAEIINDKVNNPVWKDNRDAGIVTAISNTVTDLATTATTYVSALRIKFDSNVSFLKDIIRKIRLPMYTIDMNSSNATYGKITSLGIPNEDKIYANLEKYAEYLFNKVPAETNMAVPTTPTSGYVIADFNNNAIGTGQVPLQTFLKKYAYHPMIKFDNYNHITGEIKDATAINIHTSIYNSSFLVNVITSPSGSTEAYIQILHDITRISQEKVAIKMDLDKTQATLTQAQTDLATAKSNLVPYQTFTKELSNGLEEMYKNKDFAKYVNAASGKGTAPNFKVVGGNKKMRGGNNNTSFQNFIASIPNSINKLQMNISPNATPENKRVAIMKALIPFAEKYGSYSNVNISFKEMYDKKISDLVAPVSSEIAQSVQEATSNAINNIIKEGMKKAQNSIKSNKKVELESLLLKNIKNMKNNQNKRNIKAAINTLLREINNKETNLIQRAQAKKASINYNLKSSSNLSASAQLTTSGNTSLNASTQQAVVNQSVVNAAQTVVAQAKETVKITNEATALLQETDHSLITPKVNESIVKANETLQNLTNETNPNEVVTQATEVIKNANNALKGLIENVKKNRANITNENEVLQILQQIRTSNKYKLSNLNTIRNQLVKNAVNQIPKKNTQPTNSGNNNYGLSFMSEGRQTNSTVTEKINHGKSLRNALNTYNSNQSENKKSALKSAYNEFVGKTNVNKSSVLNKNKLISRANAILNPTQSSSTNVISNTELVNNKQTTSENNSINSKVANLLANVKNTSSANSSLQKLDKIKAFYDENKYELSDEQIINLGMEYGNILIKITESNYSKKNKNQRNIQNYSQYMITLKGFKLRGNNTYIPNSVNDKPVEGKAELLNLIRDIERNIKLLK